MATEAGWGWSYGIWGPEVEMMRAGAQLFHPFILSKTPAPGRRCLHPGWSFQHQLTQSRNSSETHSDLCLLGNSRSCQVDQILTKELSVTQGKPQLLGWRAHNTAAKGGVGRASRSITRDGFALDDTEDLPSYSPPSKASLSARGSLHPKTPEKIQGWESAGLEPLKQPSLSSLLGPLVGTAHLDSEAGGASGLWIVSDLMQCCSCTSTLFYSLTGKHCSL